MTKQKDQKNWWWFKFEPAQYMAGSIVSRSLPAQGLFVQMMCWYWIRRGDLTLQYVRDMLSGDVADARAMDDGTDESASRVKRAEANAYQKFRLVDELKANGIIAIDRRGRIEIGFMADQLNNKMVLSETRKNVGKLGGIAKNSKTVPKNDFGYQLPIYKRREEKRREDNKRGEKSHAPEQQKVAKKNLPFVAPTLQDVRDFFTANGYDAELGERAWRGYDAGGWVDSKGNKIKNWRQKMIHVWFRADGKSKTKIIPADKTFDVKNI